MRVIFIFLFLSSVVLPTMALSFDVSVDEEIRKKYDSSKLQYEVLPNLPKVNSSPQATSQVVQVPVVTQAKPVITPVLDKSTALKISKWTTFQVKSNQVITDKLRQGTSVSFTTIAPVYGKSVTLPVGTKFTGVITDSHSPQLTGNGGLVVIKINGITYNGKTYFANGKITKANSKNIFLNNIKGKRKYISGIGSQIDKGEKFYQKTRKTSSKMANNPVLVFLSPIPTVVGVMGSAVTTILSPITAISTKGGTISIPSGSVFEIKLLDNAYLE